MKAFLRIKSMILGSSCFFFRPETFKDKRISSLNNRLVIKTAIFILEQLLINIWVNSERESRSLSSDGSSKPENTAEADTQAAGVEFTVWLEVGAKVPFPPNDVSTAACVCCPPKDCCVDTVAAEVDGSVWCEANVSSPPNIPAEVDGPWCEANVRDAPDGI